MIEPLQRDEAFLADVARARADRERLHVWWLGQSGFLMQWDNRHLLLDPYLSDSLTAKYALTDKPHVRMTARVVAPERLDFIDVVTSSHNHTDHLDADTLRPLCQVNPDVSVIVPEANRHFAAERIGLRPERLTGVDAGVSVTIAGFKLTGVPAAHEVLERDELGRHRYLGYVVQCGPWTIYHSGDTVCYEGMVESLSPWRIDLALLPINGRDPARRVAGNLDGPEAAALGRAISARIVVPCHYEMFEFNTADPGLFVQAAKKLGQQARVLKCGERWSSAELD